MRQWKHSGELKKKKCDPNFRALRTEWKIK